MTAPLIELNDVTRRYDDGPPALDDVSLTVAHRRGASPSSGRPAAASPRC